MKINQTINGGLRRIVCLVALLVIFVTGARAVDYDLWVGGVRVTSSNASNVTGSNIKAYTSNYNGGKASVVYNNSTKTLTLWNVSIERTGTDNRAIKNEISGLTVILKETNYLQALNSSPLRFNANTTLKCVAASNGVNDHMIVGGSEDAITVGSGATLTIDNALLDIRSASSCFDASGNPSLIIKNSTIKTYCKTYKSNDCYALHDYKQLAVYNSSVSLEGYSDAINNLTTLILGTGMCIQSPIGGYFDSSKKTVIAQSGARVSSVLFEMGIAVNATNFPDANFLSYVKSNCDKDKDGYLNTDEINIQEINVQSKSIASLKGIEHFTALNAPNVLTCNGNKLTSLDLSKNTALYQVFCQSNQLKSLDLQGNTRLTTLYCNGNQLTSINLTKNTLLENLDCSNNQLSSLNLKNNTKLKSVSCWGNKISGSYTTTFISNLPTVTNGILYFINNLYDEGNSITSAQVAAAKAKGWSVKQKNSNGNWIDYPGSDAIAIDTTNFPDANFRSYISSQCDSNGDYYLTPAEISAVKTISVPDRSITDLTGIAFFTALTELNCGNNQLTTLNLNKNTALKIVYCFRNKIRGSYTNTFINSLPKVSGGNLCFYSNETSTGNAMTSAQVAAANAKGWSVKAFVNSSSWQDYPGSDAIAIDATNFPDKNFRNWLLAQDYGKDGYLTPAEIASVTNISVPDMQITSLDGIEYFTELKGLWCSRNELQTLDVSHNTKLTNLSCDVNELTELDVTNNTALTILYCNNNRITGDGMAKLVNSLPRTSGNLYVYSEAEADGNVITPMQVQTAKSKGWKVAMCDSNWSWPEYNGLVVPGDANGNGKVDTADLEILRDYILGLDPLPFFFDSADADGSGTVDIVDLTLLIEMLK